MTLNSGRCRLNSDNNFILAFEDSDFSGDFVSVKPNNYPQDITICQDYGTIKRTFMIKNVRFGSIADAEKCMENLVTLSKAGAAYKLEWAVHSTPTYFEFDGTQAYMMVFCKSFRNLTHESKADQGVFLIKQILFVEASKS